MCKTDSIRYASIAALGLFTILWGQAWAAPDATPGAADVLEVQVLEAQVQQGEGELVDVSYRMEVLSVIQATSGVQPGETVAVRSYGQSKQALERGWMGTAYLNPDPKGASTDGERQFVLAAPGASLVDLPPAPPSLTFTREVPKDGQ
jgi:hypothetical protein